MKKKGQTIITNQIQPNEKKQDTSPIIPQRSKLKNDLHIIERFKLTERQLEFIRLATDKNTKMIFVSGPAGSTKSYLSILAAMKLLNERKVSDLIYVRSIVESADSKIGYLPGEIDSKVHPYMEVLYDKLTELLPKNELDILIKDQRISTIPVSFLRGLHWNAKCIFVDECIDGKHYIQTNTGKMKISSLYKKFSKNQSLPLVNTFNEKTGIFENKKITQVVSKGLRDTITVVLGNRKIVCTPEHKFLTGCGWIEAKDLTPYTPIIANNEPILQTLDVINDDQLQIVLGSYLGDGHLQKVGENRYRLKIIHGVKQKNYCEWKASMFNREVSFVKENGYSKKPAYQFSTKCFSLPYNMSGEKKTSCAEWVVDKIDARGIAIWYMDDGNINKLKNNIKLYTCSFDLASQNLFVKKFKSLGIDCEIKEDKGVEYCYYYLNFNAENSRKLMDLIRLYIHEDLNYKMNSLTSENYSFNNKFLPYRYIIPDRVYNNKEKTEVFDIGVEDNHNFIITSSRRGRSKQNSGVVVHNCQNCTYKEIVTIITRIGEYSKIILAGDVEQSDVNGKSGLVKIMSMFDDEESKLNGIHVFKFTEDDILRSQLVKFIVKKLRSQS